MTSIEMEHETIISNCTYQMVEFIDGFIREYCSDDINYDIQEFERKNENLTDLLLIFDTEVIKDEVINALLKVMPGLHIEKSLFEITEEMMKHSLVMMDQHTNNMSVLDMLEEDLNEYKRKM